MFNKICIVLFLFTIINGRDIIDIIESDKESPETKIKENEEEVDFLNLIKNNFHNNKNLVDGNLNAKKIDKLVKIINERRRKILDDGLIKIKKNIKIIDLFYSFIIVVIVFILILFLYFIKNKLTEVFYEKLIITFYTITKDFLFIYFIFSILFIVFSFINNEYINYVLYIENILIYFLILIIFWVILCLIKLSFIQFFCKIWEMYETKISNKSEFLKNVYNNDKIKNKNILLNVVNFIIMRDNFINSFYIPPIKEFLLRNDFKFSYYLIIYSSKIVKKYFSFNILSYFSFLIGLIISFFINNILYILIIFCVGMIFIIIVLIHLTKLKNKFIVFNENLEILKFIKEGIVPKDFELNFYPNFAKLRNNNYSYKSNKQEKFFIFDSPEFLIKMIQFFEILITNIFIFNLYLLKKNFTSQTISFYIIFSLIFIIGIANNILIIYFLKYYIICTHGSFLKNPKIIEETLNKQKKDIVLIYKNCFKAIKFILRENIIKKDNKKLISFDNILTKQIYNISEIFIKNKNNRITINNIKEIAFILGYRLDNFEWESISEFCLINLNELETSKNPLDFNKFINHIEFTMDECKRDPYKIIQSFLKNNSLVLNNYIDLNKLKNLLVHKSLLSKKCIDNLIFDLLYLSQKNFLVEEQRFLNYFRNMIEQYET